MKPRRLVLFTLFFVLSATCIEAQNGPFAGFNFDDGGYTLVGIFAHHSDHPVQKKIGQFFVRDIKVLKDIQRTWSFPREQRMYTCGYHYNILLLKDGVRLEGLSINLECDEIVTAQGSRYFDSSHLIDLKSRVEPLKVMEKEFGSIEDARRYWNSLSDDPNFVFATEPKWVRYDGRFRFRTKCPPNNRDCYYFGKDSEVLAEVSRKIRDAYPNEPFELKTSGGSSEGEVYFEITCGSALADKFDIFDRWNRKLFGKFEVFPLYLRSYWKN